MTRNRSVPDGSLLDSFASLRIADRMVRELDAGDDIGPGTLDPQTLHKLLIGAYREIAGILGSLRQSRFMLERTTMERIQRSQEKLLEVSSATETAASDMLDGLDRSLGIVEQLDSVESGDQARSLRATLRDELFRVITCLQFQDITSQQLKYASGVLGELESRMSALVGALEGFPGFEAVVEEMQAAPENGPTTFDPFASTHNAPQRQAIADEIFVDPSRPDPSPQNG